MPEDNTKFYNKASKTDPFRKGVNLYIGRTNNDLCHTAAMMAYLAIQGDSEGPLFCFRSGQPLTCERFDVNFHYLGVSRSVNHDIFK